MSKIEDAIQNMLIVGINPDDVKILKENTTESNKALDDIQYEVTRSIEKAKSDPSLYVYLPVFGTTQKILNDIKDIIYK